jgi:hypothetical protein
MVDIEKQVANLRFDLLRNAIYHTARSLFFDRCTRALNFLVIIFGTSAAAQLGQGRIDSKWLAFGAAIFGAVQLVGDFSGAARVHGYLQRRCYELLAELEGIVSPDESQIASIRAKLTTVYGEEPPPMRALDAVAYNAACDSVGRDDERVKINWWQSLFAQLYPFNGTKFIDAPIAR